MATYRQGDVLIFSAPAGAKPGARVKRERGRIVLAYGELTGHAHAIASKDATLYALGDTPDADRLLRIRRPVALTHEEHSTINLPVGDFVVRRQRTYEPEAIRVVAD